MITSFMMKEITSIAANFKLTNEVYFNAKYSVSVVMWTVDYVRKKFFLTKSISPQCQSQKSNLYLNSQN